MVEFLRLQYQMSRVSLEQLNKLVEQGRISQEDFDFITQ